MPSGIGGTPVRALRAGAAAAWVETVSERSIAPSVEGARTHDAVIQAALTTGVTPLPMRFGQTFDSDDECMQALRAQEARLVGDLDRVRGLVEMRVVIALHAEPEGEPPADVETPGRAYMHRLLRGRSTEQFVHASAAAVRAQLSAIVQPFARDEAFVVSFSPRAVLTVSHLVARDDVSLYRAAVDDVALGAHVERVVVCGPVAPYQFVSPPE